MALIDALHRSRASVAAHSFITAASLILAGCGQERANDGDAVQLDSSAMSELAAQIDSIARSIGGEAGVAARVTHSGRRFSLNGDQAFPMASVYKLPIALAVLDLVDLGKLNLDSVITIPERDFAPHYSPLAEDATGPVTLSIARLLVLMLAGSDNTATDALLRAIGGPGVVTRRMEELGLHGIRVDRTERELGFAQRGLAEWPSGLAWSRARFDSVAAVVPSQLQREAEERFLADQRDSATPNAMASLLEIMAKGNALSPSGMRRLQSIMATSRIGERRIPGDLPPGAEVLHKTGTTNTIANDVGLVRMPGSREELAVAIFLKGSRAPLREREAAIAQMARLVVESLSPPSST